MGLMTVEQLVAGRRTSRSISKSGRDAFADAYQRREELNARAKQIIAGAPTKYLRERDDLRHDLHVLDIAIADAERRL